jgi:hypothetical protein
VTGKNYRWKKKIKAVLDWRTLDFHTAHTFIHYKLSPQICLPRAAFGLSYTADKQHFEILHIVGTVCQPGQHFSLCVVAATLLSVFIQQCLFVPLRKLFKRAYCNMPSSSCSSDVFLTPILTHMSPAVPLTPILTHMPPAVPQWVPNWILCLLNARKHTWEKLNLKQLYKINLYRLYFVAQPATLMWMGTEPHYNM